ncbi:MAG: RNA-binding S4 domain-containing protein [Erysipelotrichaceae bacterium]|nr:RNA-binding S4 domain-containing protein [Erysipelotrichaceae bacterium]
MRIDKYLKVARIVKRRETSKELTLNQRLFINDRLAKAANEVKIGDIITIVFGHRTLKVRVLDIREHVKKDDTDSLYEIIED